MGIDIAKDKHYAFFGTADGKTLWRRLIFENNLAGFSKLIARANAIRDQNGLTKIVFGFEPTSNYHKPLGIHLIRCAHEVVMVSGVAVKKNHNQALETATPKEAAAIMALVVIACEGLLQFFAEFGKTDLFTTRIHTDKLVNTYSRYA